MSVQPTQAKTLSLRDLERQYAEAASDRLRAYLELGRRAHQLVRKGELADLSCQSAVVELRKTDRLVFALGKEISKRRAGPQVPLCPNCQAPVSEGDRYCGSCGRPIEPKTTSPESCPACGADFEGPARYCPACGTALESPAKEG